MRVALDAMGGDKTPVEIIKGALQAVNLYPELEKIFLVGKEEEIKKHLNGNLLKKLFLIDAGIFETTCINFKNMDDHPEPLAPQIKSHET